MLRKILGALCAACVATGAGATPLLIGTYTGGQSKGVYLYDFDTQTGRIAPAPTQMAPANNPSWLVLSPDRRFLYAVNENSDGQSDPVGRVTAWRMNPVTGRLAPLNRISSLGADPTHASLSRDGRFLFIANYSGATDPGGTLAVAPIARNGALGPVVQVKTHRASMANPDRQLAPHVHSAVSSPDGRFVFAQDLGADRIYAYAYDGAAREHPLSAVKGQPWIDLPAGSGPRHMVFSPDGRHAYLTLEMTGQVAVLDHADGRLTLRQTLALAPAGFTGKLGAAALHISPDGRFLSLTNRGSDNSIITFAIAPGDGALSLVDRHPTGGMEPREFAFSPDGRFVLVANQRSGAVLVFARDVASGVVGAQVSRLAIDQASDIKFLK